MTDRPGDSDEGSDSDVTQVQASKNRSAEVIGPYRLLEQIGEGAMGEVWLAEQTRPVRRRVALKLVKAGMDTAQVLVRFDAERQALALMNHPAIARVFDAGATPQGRPYFVMEYVPGEPITVYCSGHRLSIAERIELFSQVCDGVQHAHQKGIIHRDLKPSNVLLTLQDGRPVPKIIDFGVAKATTQALTERTLHTEFGALVGTPEYMSPEQAEMTGLDVDTRTDVYALGVILYELLVGVLPFESKVLRAKGVDEIRRTIREVDPARPSARVTTLMRSAETSPHLPVPPQRLASQLRGDLDWITMKAMEKDRTHRYGSASDLAADLRRHLEHQPVLAGRPSNAYRLRKFVRRNRLAVGVAVTLTVFLVAFATTMAVQAQRIARERDRTNREAERANREAAAATQVSQFLIGLFNVSDPSEARGNALTAREILDQGAEKIEKELTSQPEVQARLMETMGKVYTNLGLYRSAESLLYRAVATNRRTLGNDHPQTLTALNELANLFWYQTRMKDAEPLYLEVLEGRRRVLGAEHPDTLRASYDLSSLYSEQSRWSDAERLGQTTLETQRTVLGNDHPDTLNSMSNLSTIYYRQRQYAEALPLEERATAIRRAKLGADHPFTFNGSHNLATIYDHLQQYTAAEPVYLETIEAKRRILGPDHPSTILTTQSLAAMYQKQKRFDKAASLLLASYDVLTAKNSGDVRTVYSRGTTSSEALITQLANLYDAWGQPQKAAEWKVKLSRFPGKP